MTVPVTAFTMDIGSTKGPTPAPGREDTEKTHEKDLGIE